MVEEVTRLKGLRSLSSHRALWAHRECPRKEVKRDDSEDKRQEEPEREGGTRRGEEEIASGTRKPSPSSFMMTFAYEEDKKTNGLPYISFSSHGGASQEKNTFAGKKRRRSLPVHASTFPLAANPFEKLAKKRVGYLREKGVRFLKRTLAWQARERYGARLSVCTLESEGIEIGTISYTESDRIKLRRSLRREKRVDFLLRSCELLISLDNAEDPQWVQRKEERARMTRRDRREG